MPKQTVSCDNCGVELERYPSHVNDRNYCDKDCMAEGYSSRDSPRVTLKCEICCDEYEAKPTNAGRRRFCSYECMGRWRSENATGPANPSWAGGGDDLECEYCGDEYTVTPAKADGSRFCSRSCLYDFRSENASGQNSHRWRGGGSIRKAVRLLLPGKWREIRADELSDECALCGTAERLQLHHIVPLLAGGTHVPENLMTVCVGCHNTVEAYVANYTAPVLLPHYYSLS